MGKYRINRAVEHDQTLYLPRDWAAPAKVRSVGNGLDIPVDTSGTIELDDEHAKALAQGPISPVAEAPAPPPAPEQLTDSRPAAQAK